MGRMLAFEVWWGGGGGGGDYFHSFGEVAGELPFMGVERGGELYWEFKVSMLPVGFCTEFWVSL